MIIPASTIDIAKRIASISDHLRLKLDDHTYDNDGEILPHIFFGDVARRAIHLAEKHGVSKDNNDELSRIVGELEASYSADDQEVMELISVSFLENVENSRVVDVLGRGLRSEMERIQAGRSAFHR